MEAFPLIVAYEIMDRISSAVVEFATFTGSSWAGWAAANLSIAMMGAEKVYDMPGLDSIDQPTNTAFERLFVAPHLSEPSVRGT